MYRLSLHYVHNYMNDFAFYHDKVFHWRILFADDSLFLVLSRLNFYLYPLKPKTTNEKNRTLSGTRLLF